MVSCGCQLNGQVTWRRSQLTWNLIGSIGVTCWSKTAKIVPIENPRWLPSWKTISNHFPEEKGQMTWNFIQWKYQIDLFKLQPWGKKWLVLKWAIQAHLGPLVLFFHENICCGYSLEAPHWGASNGVPTKYVLWRNKKNISIFPLKKVTYLKLCKDYSKHMFAWRNKKNIYLHTPLILGPIVQSLWRR